MSKKQQPKAPAGLIAELGTGEDKLGLIGKRIRIVDNDGYLSSCPRELRFILRIPEVDPGAEGVVVHVDANGHYWADFGDDERAKPFNTQDGLVNVHDIAGHNPGEDIVIHEVIE